MVEQVLGDTPPAGYHDASHRAVVLRQGLDREGEAGHGGGAGYVRPVQVEGDGLCPGG